MNGSWIISQRCSVPYITVNCIDGSWSEDIACPETTHPTLDVTSTELTAQTSPELTAQTSPNTNTGKT